ncbi:MAG: hypothetical protein PHT95_04430, partial [Candidatus Omnitrophica bacterium]|nr:hypothetical protein [Candidatus Omnitrophota bacterium]
MNPEQLKQAFDEFKTAQLAANEAVKVMVKEQEKGTKEGLASAVALAEKAARDVQVCADKIVAMEQKLTQKIIAGTEAPKTFGQILVEDPAYKAFASGQTQKCRITLKNGFSAQNNTIT